MQPARTRCRPTRLHGRVLAAIISSVLLSPVAADGPAEPALRRQVLPSGLRTIVLARPASPIVSIELRVRAGSADTTPGAAHLLEHSLFHGSRERRHGEIDRLIETIGAEIDARTFRDSTRFRLDVPADRWRDALSVLAELVLTPTLASERLDIERRIIAEERLHAAADPVRSGVQQLLETWFVGDPYAQDPLGTPQALADIGSDQLRALHRSTFRPDRMSLVIGGPVDPAEVARVADALFVAENSTAQFRKPSVPAPAPPANPKPLRIPATNRSTVWVHAGFRLDASDTDAVATAEAVCQWLADPEHGPWSESSTPRPPLQCQVEVIALRRAVVGMVRCQVDPANAADFPRTLRQRLTEWADAPDTMLQAQWADVRARALARWDRDNAATTSAVARIALHEGRDAAGDEDRIRARLAAISEADLRAMFRKLVAPSAIRFVQVGGPAPGPEEAP